MSKKPFASGGGVVLARAAGAFMPGFGTMDGNSLTPGRSQESLGSPATPATAGTLGFNSPPPPPRSLSGVSLSAAPTMKYGPGPTVDLSTPSPQPVLPDAR